MRLQLSPMVAVTVLTLASTTQACLHWAITLQTGYYNMWGGFNDDGVETCEGMYVDSSRQGYYHIPCISGYSAQVALHDNHFGSVRVDYVTPHGLWSWVSNTAEAVPGTVAATGSMFGC